LYKTNCIFMSNESPNSKVSLPSADTIIRDVKTAIKMPRKVANMDRHNAKFVKRLQALLA